ncbi:hypothetical protein JB92DRAFT_1413119 [Gautieria morchelliformis]|nr:hypothetical protein JB92DRAFT_1413119 [Gautieria morchelliformis]
MTHEHLGLNLTPPPSQMQRDQSTEQGAPPGGPPARHSLHQRADHQPHRLNPTARNREAPSAEACNQQGAPPIDREVAAKLKEQEEEIIRLRAEIANTRSQQQQPQPQQQPTLPQQQQPQQPPPPQQQPPPQLQHQPPPIQQQPGLQLQQQPDPTQTITAQQHTQPGNQEPLFADEAAVERARAEARDEKQRVQLLNLVPGFKASALDIGKSPMPCPTYRTPHFLPASTSNVHFAEQAER